MQRFWLKLMVEFFSILQINLEVIQEKKFEKKPFSVQIS